MEMCAEQPSSSDPSPTGEVNSYYEKAEIEHCTNENDSSKSRKPSGESTATELSSIATSTPSSSPLVSAATSISSAQAAFDDTGGLNSPLSEENIDLSSSESLDTKNQTSPNKCDGSAGDIKTDSP